MGHSHPRIIAAVRERVFIPQPGIDQDGNGSIDSTEGVNAAAPNTLIGNRDGLRQTASPLPVWDILIPVLLALVGVVLAARVAPVARFEVGAMCGLAAGLLARNLPLFLIGAIVLGSIALAMLLLTKVNSIGLLIHDAYRPWYLTRVFWDAVPDDKKIFEYNYEATKLSIARAMKRSSRSCARSAAASC